MSVEYRAVLGYGLILPQVSDEEPWELIEQEVANYDLITHESGGGGWSSTKTQYTLLIRSTVKELGEIDGVVTLEKPKISSDALTQLYDAFAAITDNGEYVPTQWLLVGGFY